MDFPAELAYLFRQPLMRDAAYQLQVPSDRARLHRMAMEILEEMFDGPPPEPKPDKWGDLKCEPHPMDAVAADMAEHAARIREWEGKDGTMFRRELLYLHRSAAYAEAQFHNQDAIRLWQLHAKALLESNPGRAAESLRRAGAVTGRSGRPPDAEPLFERARKLAVAAGNRRTEAHTLGNLGLVHHILGRVEEGERLQKQALAVTREFGYRRAEAMVLANLANAYGETTRFEEAEQTQQQALDIFREVGDRNGEGVALTGMAILYRLTERVEEAEKVYGRALEILREVGDGRTEALVLGNLAILYQHSGRLDRADRTFSQALAILHETRDRRIEGMNLCNYAICLLEMKRREAGETWRAGAGILKEIGDTGSLDFQISEMRKACAKASVPPLDE